MGIEKKAKKTDSLGSRLLALRLEAGLSRAALAEAVGTSRQYVRELELDRRGVTLALLLRLADVLSAKLGRTVSLDGLAGRE